jgi:hypothetical protein
LKEEEETKVEVAQNRNFMIDHMIDPDIIIEISQEDQEVETKDMDTNTTLTITQVGDIEEAEQRVEREEDSMTERDLHPEITRISKDQVSKEDTNCSKHKVEVVIRDKILKKEEL